MRRPVFEAPSITMRLIMSEINFDAPHDIMALMQVLQTTLIRSEDVQIYVEKIIRMGQK